MIVIWCDCSPAGLVQMWLLSYKAVWPWISYWTSLSLGFLIGAIGIAMLRDRIVLSINRDKLLACWIASRTSSGCIPSSSLCLAFLDSTFWPSFPLWTGWKTPPPPKPPFLFLRTSKLLGGQWLCCVHLSLLNARPRWMMSKWRPCHSIHKSNRTFLYCTSVWKSNFTIHLLFSLLSVLWDGIYCYHFTVTCKWLVSCSNCPRSACWYAACLMLHSLVSKCAWGISCVFAEQGTAFEVPKWEADLIPAETQHFNEQF